MWSKLSSARIAFTLIKSNCVRPPHPKGWGMLRAARPHARFYGIQKSSSFRWQDPIDQNYRNSVFGSRESLLTKSKKKWKPGEGSLHPRPEGQGIRDPPRSQCNKIRHIKSRVNHPQTNGKLEKWNDTYETNRFKFENFDNFVNWYNTITCAFG